MGADSKIQWTDHTFNPWWGCARVSPGCEHCYAEALAKRTGRAAWGPKEERVVTSDTNWKLPLKWDRAARDAGKRARVFCASMADVFEDREDLAEHRERLWALIQHTPNLDWLLLTKRPENLDRMLPWTGLMSAWANVWVGTTVEDQKRANERVPLLLKVPAQVRFLSCEPLLERVDLIRAVGEPDELAWDMVNNTAELEPDVEPEELVPESEAECDAINYGNELVENPEHREWKGRRLELARIEALRGLIDWVIIGGESGPGARPFQVKWVYDMLEQCRVVGMAPFVKQLGSKLYGGGDRIRTADRKGGNPDEWPEEINVREFPR